MHHVSVAFSWSLCLISMKEISDSRVATARSPLYNLSVIHCDQKIKVWQPMLCETLQGNCNVYQNAIPIQDSLRLDHKMLILWVISYGLKINKALDFLINLNCAIRVQMIKRFGLPPVGTLEKPETNILSFMFFKTKAMVVFIINIQM